MTEFERVAVLKELFEAQNAATSVFVGIGDDAAVLAPDGKCSQVMSVDCSVENVHFRRDFAPWEKLAARAFVTALSDLAAMGASPRAALLNWQLPGTIADEEFLQMGRGFAAAASMYKVPIVGGNLSRASEVSWSTTVIGAADSRNLLRRNGAKSGHSLYVTGPLGGAALGLRLLHAGKKEEGAEFVEKWLNPAAQIRVGERLCAEAAAAIDISDGLIADLRHMCLASGVGARVYWNEMPRAKNFVDSCTRHGFDARSLCLHGGEDYELLYAARASETARELGTRIGEVTDACGVIELIDEDGKSSVITNAQGWEHF